MIEVAPISRDDAWIRQLAEGFAAEWPQWAKTITRAELESGFVGGEGGDLPVVLVAHEHGRALGTVALRRWFAEQPMAESPWVRGLYIVPGYRGRGVERLAVRRGWRVFRRIEHEGAPMAWMSRSIGSRMPHVS